MFSAIGYVLIGYGIAVLMPVPGLSAFIIEKWRAFGAYLRSQP